MTEPNTANVGLIVPNTGDLSGTWGSAALNPNFSSIDGLFGGKLALSLSAATTITLSISTTVSLAPGAGPFQSQNALISLSGTLSGNAIIKVQQPGYYIVHNACTVGSFYVQFAPSAGGGNAVGAIPGKKQHIFYDGTNVDFVNMPDPGTAYDLHGITALPAWMGACTVAPYLLKDGSTHTASVFPALAALLGSTFGGDGVTIFGVPDERARARLGYDGGATGRLTTAVSGVNGATMGSAGGNQSMQQHNHTLNVTITDPGHVHPQMNPNFKPGGGGGGGVGGGQEVLTGGAWPTVNATTNITASGTAANTGSGASQNVQPSIVSFLPLIKT